MLATNGEDKIIDDGIKREDLNFFQRRYRDNYEKLLLGKKEGKLDDSTNLLQKIFWNNYIDKWDLDFFLRRSDEKERNYQHRIFTFYKWLINEYFGIKAIKDYLTTGNGKTFFYEFFHDPYSVIKSTKLFNQYEIEDMEYNFYSLVGAIIWRIEFGEGYPDPRKTRETMVDNEYYKELLLRCFWKTFKIYGLKFLDMNKCGKQFCNIKTDADRERLRRELERKEKEYIDGCVNITGYISKLGFLKKHYLDDINVGFMRQSYLMGAYKPLLTKKEINNLH